MALSCYPAITKQLKLSDDTTYAYAYSPPSLPGKATFLLLHGFPSSSYDWRHQVKDLSEKGFGVLAPDLLGYGDTDSPNEVEAYQFRKMCGHVHEILGQEGLERVIGVGHDWGAHLLGRFINFYPGKLLGTVFIALGYTPPSTTPLDLDAMNASTAQAFGVSLFGYWQLFNSPSAGTFLDKHHEGLTSLLYPPSADLWKYHLGPVGAAEEFLTSTKQFPRAAEWLTTEEIANHDAVLMQKGYHGPCNWYKSAIINLDAEENAIFSEEALYVKAPSLLVLAKNDIVGPAVQLGSKKWYRDVKVVEVEAGHWVQLEIPGELNNLLVEFGELSVK